MIPTIIDTSTTDVINKVLISNSNFAGVNWKSNILITGSVFKHASFFLAVNYDIIEKTAICFALCGTTV